MFVLSLISYLLLVGAAWLFRVSYVGWLGPYLLALAVSLPLLLLLVSLPGILSLGISMKAPSRIMQGKNSSLMLFFRNPMLFPVHSVTVHLEIKNRYTGEVSRQNYLFRGVETSSSSLPLPTQFCGELQCRVLRFECRDALGLFCFRRKCPAEARSTVMPMAVETEEAVNFEAALSTASILRPKYGGGYAEEHDLRDYRPGDTANSIHWKLSSKTDSLIVREALVPENSTVYLVLSQVGEHDRGLEVLRWLSGKLLEMEEPHVIVADSLYPVGNSAETDDAIASLLSWPIQESCGFDARNARCVFYITAGEVRWQ
ncbi:MAG: DUF58 domain-containing protein [Oscillospiraceae bacterium]|nr:DUF58 domain-containing protein [Oscillospiraceae bacterium]